jgi:signal peptidase
MSVELTTLPPRTRRGGSLVLNAACVLITLLALLFILPAAFGLSRYVITGGSMSGTIERGAVVFEETVPVADLAVGDIITYLPPAESGLDTLVTHRIVSIDGDTFRTRGDANADVDPWTFQLSSTVQPRVVADVPYVGYLFIALADRGTRMLVIGVPAAIIALLSLRELASGLRRRPRSKAAAAASEPADAPGVEIPAARKPVRSVVAHPRTLG